MSSVEANFSLQDTEKIGSENKHDERMEQELKEEPAPIQPTPKMALSMEHEFMLTASKRKAEFLRDVVREMEDSFAETKELNEALQEESGLIEKVKALQKKQIELHDVNQSLFMQNQEDALTLQYLELNREMRAPEVFAVPTTPGTSDGTKTPPAIKTSLEARPQTPSKTKEIIDHELDQAEKRREDMLRMRRETIQQRDKKYAENKERALKIRQDAEAELAKKMAMAAEKREKQKQKLKEQEQQKVEQRRQAAEALKQFYDEQEAKHKERVGEPEPIRDIHAQQKMLLEQQNEQRKANVLLKKAESLKLERTEHAKRLRKIALGEKGDSPINIKALKEAKERKEKPEKFRTPVRPKSPHESPVDEIVLHSKIISEIEKLKMRASTTREREQLEIDFTKENARHLQALKKKERIFLEQLSDSDLPPLEKMPSKNKENENKENEHVAQPPLKLEFKLEEETSKKRRNKQQLDEEARLNLENRPFKSDNKPKKSSRKPQVKSTPPVDCEPSPLRKKYKPVKPDVVLGGSFS